MNAKSENNSAVCIPYITGLFPEIQIFPIDEL